MDGDSQVGYVRASGGGKHAAVWTGAPASWADLHVVLPANFANSEALGISHEGGTTYVVGYAMNNDTTHIEAMLWVWNPPCTAPAVTGDPASLNLCADDTAVFTVVGFGTAPLTYVWRKETVAIDAGLNPSAATASLVLVGVSNADEGTYDCVISNSCGSATSAPATLTVTDCPPPCDPDVNCDGSINGFDIEATEQAVNGDYSNFCQSSADLNNDGAENGFDIETEEQRVNGEPC